MHNTLVVDSGSTKAQWAFMGQNGMKRHTTAGANPLFISEFDLINLMLSVSSEVGRNVDNVYFYGSGCIDGKNKQMIVRALRETFANAEIEVESDMLGAARALFGHEPGIACILGTGSNSCFFDGERMERNVRSLGYIIGDEGSGSHIGRLLLADVLKGLCGKELEQTLFDWCRMTYPEIIENIYAKPYANRFLARFSLFANEHIDNQYVRAVVERSFGAFADRCLAQYPEAQHHPVSFVGSVAASFGQILRLTLEHRGYQVGQIMQAPIEGLIKYHKNGN